MAEFKAVVHVMLRRSILDPQGRAVAGTLERLDYRVDDVRVGKRIELRLSGEKSAVETEVRSMAERVLSNPVMEEVDIELIELDG